MQASPTMHPGGADRPSRLHPSTRPGRLASLLALAFVVLFTVFTLLIVAGQRGGETFSDNLVLSLTGLAAMVASLAAGSAGIVAIVRGERSLPAFGAAAIGVVVLFFVVGELISPH